jgi:hypothetical protein
MEFEIIDERVTSFKGSYNKPYDVILDSVEKDSGKILMHDTLNDRVYFFNSNEDLLNALEGTYNFCVEEIVDMESDLDKKVLTDNLDHFCWDNELRFAKRGLNYLRQYIISRVGIQQNKI